MGAGAQFLSVQGGAPTTLLATTTLTASYQFTTSVDLQSYDSLAVETTVTLVQTGKTANIRIQWSHDDTNWTSYETVDASSAVSANDQPVVPYIKRIDLSMDSAASTYIGSDMRRLQRKARFVRLAYKSDAVTTGKIAITSYKMNNGN
jgi:hypothetical protein